MTIPEIMLSHGEKTDATSYPFWFIAKKGGFGHVTFLDGIWFNREDATAYLEARRHHYGKSAFVWCASGCYSWHLRAMYDAAAEVAHTAKLKGAA